MNARKYKEIEKNEILMIDIDGLCKMLSVGRKTAEKIAILANARVNLPCTKLVRYNVSKIRDYVESVTF